MKSIDLKKSGLDAFCEFARAEIGAMQAAAAEQLYVNCDKETFNEKKAIAELQDTKRSFVTALDILDKLEQKFKKGV